jgi:outer membrane protein TolC
MDKNQILSDLDIRSIRSRYYPSLSLNTGYTYTNSESQAGFLLSNRTTGFTYGASLNLTLFNRLENRRLMQNARIEQENRELEINDLKLTLTSNLNQVWNNYNNNLRILALESQNLESARENLDIARARYRLGDLAGIEMREIQQNFLNASNRFINAQYLAKVAEITLKQISGSIEEYF